VGRTTEQLADASFKGLKWLAARRNSDVQRRSGGLGI